MVNRTTRSSGVNRRLVDVVLVDDDADTRELLQIALRDHEYAVRIAAGVDEALTQIDECAPHVVVTDLDLGRGQSGWMIASALRDDPSTRHIPIIAISGSAVEPDDVLAVFDVFLQKPVELRRLVDALRELTDVRRPQRRVGA